MHVTLRRTFSIVLATVLMAAVAASGGCAPKQATTTTTTGEVAKGGTISFELGDITAIDPYNAQESEGTQVTQALFDSLTVIDPKTGEVLPAAAEKWSSNADATVWTFNLVPGAKFADGTPVTADDFVYAWNRIAVSAFTNAKDPAQIAYHLGPIVGFDKAQESGTPMAGVKAIDDKTLEITLSSAFADWPYVMAHPALAPVPKALVEGGVDYNGAKVPFAEMPVGNGPFKMSEPWKHDQYIKVVAQRRLLRQEAEHRRRRLHDLQGSRDRLPRVPGRQPGLHADPRRSDRSRQDVVRRLGRRLHGPAGQGRAARRRDGDLLPLARQREGPAGQPEPAQGHHAGDQP